MQPLTHKTKHASARSSHMCLLPYLLLPLHSMLQVANMFPFGGGGAIKHKFISTTLIPGVIRDCRVIVRPPTVAHHIIAYHSIAFHAMSCHIVSYRIVPYHATLVCPPRFCHPEVGAKWAVNLVMGLLEAQVRRDWHSTPNI